MASLVRPLQSALSRSTSNGPEEGKNEDVVQSTSIQAQADGVGELSFDEYTQGGLGRHLGIVSTAFLMLVNSLDNQQRYILTKSMLQSVSVASSELVSSRHLPRSWRA